MKTHQYDVLRGAMSLTIAVTAYLVWPQSQGSDVASQHNNSQRTGANLNETQLSTSNVNAGTFGRIAQSAYVNGRVQAQPLFVSSVALPNGQNADLVSIAAVALANGLNANLLRNWVVAAKEVAPAAALPVDPGFVPLAMAPASSSSEISIEVRRGEATVQVRWPIQAAGECAAWLRTWLR